MLLRLENDLRWTSQPRFHLEMGLVKLARAAHVRDIEEVILQELREGSPPGGEPPAAASPTKPARAPRPPSPPPVAPSVPAPPPPVSRPATAAPITEPRPFTFSDIFARRVEELSATTAVYLQKAQNVEQAEDQVRILMKDKTGLAQLNTAEHLSFLERAARDLIGKAASVSLIIINEQQPSGGSETQAASGSILESARDEPLVKRFLEVFRGDIAQVKPAKGE
jgi:DNA polymerase III gamma/tau subunit